MASKLQVYRQMSEQAQQQLTGSLERWQSFLTTAARLYKYPYHEQVMIHAQRPDAIACAEYDVWNDTMRRFVRRGSKGIALIDSSGSQDRLRYVFDVSDTGTRPNSRNLNLWELREEHIPSVSAMLEASYGADTTETLAAQFERVATQLAGEYWEDNKRDILDILENSFLEGYDEFNAGVAFRNAAEVSITYSLLSRCGMNPDEYFEHEDFMSVFDFNTPELAGALGTAVSGINQQMLREIGAVIRNYEREQLAERSADHGNDLHTQRGLSDPGHPVVGADSEAPGEVRSAEENLPAGASPHPVESSDSVGTAVPTLSGDRRDGAPETGRDDSANGSTGRRDGGTEADRPAGLGGDDEQPENSGGGNSVDGAGVQLNIEEPAEAVYEQISMSLFPSEQEQISRIEEADRTQAVQSAFSFSQPEIDDILRFGSNTTHAREHIADAFQKQKSVQQIAVLLQQEFHGGYGIKGANGDYAAWYAEDGIHLCKGRSARYSSGAQILSWEDAAQRISQLLEEGSFATNVELAEAAGQVRSELAHRLLSLKRDIREDDRADGYLACLDGLPMGYPDATAVLSEQMTDPVFQETLRKEYAQFALNYSQNRSLLRFHYHRIESIWQGINDLMLPWREYENALAEHAPVQGFITEDEIDQSLMDGSSFQGGKNRIYEYFTAGHTPKEKADFLKKEYGIGGRSHALSGADHSSENHSGKGMRLTKADCAPVELKWAKVAERITALIQMDHYFTPEQKEFYDRMHLEEAPAEEIPEEAPSLEAPAEPQPITPEEITSSLLLWNGNAESKIRVNDYMLAHSRERGTAQWLKEEFGGNADTFPVSTDQGSLELPWAKVQRQLGLLVANDQFLTEADRSQHQPETKIIPIREFHRSTGEIVEGKDIPALVIDGMSRPPQIFTPDRRPIYEAVRDFESANNVAHPVIGPDGSYDDKEFLYAAYDQYVGMSHKDELSSYAQRFTSLSEGENIHEYLAQIYYAKVNGLSEDDITFMIDEINRTGHPYQLERMSKIRGLLEDTSGVWTHEAISSYESGDMNFDSAPSWNYQVGDTVYLDDTAFLVEEIRDNEVQLRDPSLIYPIFRTENRSRFEEMLIRDERNDALLMDRADKQEAAKEALLNEVRPEIDPHRYLVAAYHHFENGFDDKLDYPTLEEAERAAQGYVDGTMEYDGFKYDGTAVYDQQEQKYLRIYGDYPDEKAHAQVNALSHPDQSVLPGEATGLPYDIVLEPLHTEPELTLEEELDRNPISVQVNGEWQAYPNREAAEEAMLAEDQAQTRRNAQNFRITDDNLGVGGAKAKYQANVAAIQLLKYLEENGLQASPEQQEILSKYVGWGGIPDAFDPDKANWSSEYAQLKSLLTPEEYEAARASTLNAHFTSPVVIHAMYEALERMGFQNGNILEPSMGVGNFFGCLPESMADSRLYGVELDSITGRIAQQLYPKANITVAGFETTDRRDFYDVAIGNVPFGQYQVNDRAYNKLGFSIHDYFFAKTLDQVRPGGVIAFVTSRYTMDKQSPEVRKYIAQRAELLGAIRLPNNAFKANAGTDVVSDIIFLQRRERPMEVEPDWVHLGQNPDGFAINSYFVEHPEMILGNQSSESTQYGRQDFTVEPIESLELADQLHDAVKYIRGTYQAAELPDLGEDEKLSDTIPADPNVRNYSYAVVDGQVYYRQNSLMSKPELNATAVERVKGMVGLRDCLRKLIDQQLDGTIPDSAIKETQAELNDLYDSFSQRFGLINSRANALAFQDDSSYYLLCTLEELDEEKQLKRKADIFTKRTIKPNQVVSSVDTPSEALALSIAEKAGVDLSYMAELTGMEQADLIAGLRGVIFHDPVRQEWQTADEYLSGNVRQKLREAELAADSDSAYLPNVEALRYSQPKDLDASEIEVRLGATWIDKRYIQQFMEETFEPPFYLRRNIQVHYSPFTAEWSISGKSSPSYNDVNAYMTFGTDRANAYRILEDTLNLRDIRIYDTKIDPDGKERRVLNSKETTLAQQKQQAIKDAFREWIWRDPDRRQELVQRYNELFNSTRPREYDGRHISFSGMNPEIHLREHQLNAVAHVLYGGNTLLAHEVGAGKTFEMVAAAMESKRLGLCHKPMFVVPNHLTEQWASEFLRLYPSANILAATKKDFEPKNRKKFCARIATGDYDAIIIGHSQFERIPVSLERQERLLREQIEEITDGIEEMKSSRAERFTIKAMERTKKGLETKLKKLLESGRKDDVVTFEELGVDRLYVDEAHAFKNRAKRCA